jgi:hypothetical protein
MSGGTQGKGGSSPAATNTFQQAAGAQNAALGATSMAQGYNSQMAPGTYGYNAAMQASPDQISGGIDRYMNPYTQDVIDRTGDDIARQTAIQQTVNAGAADAAGAFGGSRHGLVESETNANAQRQFGDIAAGMRNQAYGQAANLSGMDIANQMGAANANQNAWNQAGYQNAALGQQTAQSQIQNQMGVGQQFGGLGQQSFGYGQSINQDLMNQGDLTRGITQDMIGQAAGMYDRYTGQPTDILNLRLASLGVNPLNNAGTSTTTSNPGMLDTLSAVGSAAGGVAGAAGKSSRQYKEHEVDAAPPEGLWDITPKTYDWAEGQQPEGYGRHDMKDYGLIAEEVEEVFPEAVVHDNQGRPVGLKYLPLIGALFAEVKRLRAVVGKG